MPFTGTEEEEGGEGGGGGGPGRRRQLLRTNCQDSLTLMCAIPVVRVTN